MSANTKHPEYTNARQADWLLCRDSHEGEGQIKARGERYLPKPTGYSTAGGYSDNGAAAYAAYLARAQFPEIMSTTVGSVMGIIHQREITIEMPSALEYLHENADGEGKTLVDYHRELTRELLISGRCGSLVDAPFGGGDPYFARYDGEDIINWDVGFFVLDETGDVRSGYQWTREEKYRVLELRDGRYVQLLVSSAGEEDITPSRRGGGFLERIPFAVATSKRITSEIDTPPLVGIARAARAMYQLSADYRLQLFMSGQETLVAINGEAPSAVGAGVVHQMNGSEGLPADLKYVSPTCAGIDAHLKAIEHNLEAAARAGARLFEQSQSAQESGEARKLRFQSETANIMTVAQSSCALLERSLKDAAEMVGSNPDEVVVNPPQDLLDATVDAQEAATLWALVAQGGMSFETYYDRLQRGGLMSPERSFEDELKLIEGDPEEMGAQP